MTLLDPITSQSFAMIDAELAALGIRLPTEHHPLVRRAIHSTADFTLAHALRFHPRAIKAGLAALGAGAAVVTDVNMVAVGLDRRRLATLGSRTLCRVADAEVAVEARATGSTRSAAGMRAALREAGAGAVHRAGVDRHAGFGPGAAGSPVGFGLSATQKRDSS
jgi:precorrin-8X/cobalt-precorrin-8 methylmutase